MANFERLALPTLAPLAIATASLTSKPPPSILQPLKTHRQPPARVVDLCAVWGWSPTTGRVIDAIVPLTLQEHLDGVALLQVQVLSGFLVHDTLSIEQ